MRFDYNVVTGFKYYTETIKAKRDIKINKLCHTKG